MNTPRCLLGSKKLLSHPHLQQSPLDLGWINDTSEWYIYNNESEIDEFMQSLNDRGIREHHLLTNLKKSMPLIHQEFEQMKKLKSNPSDSSDADLEDLIESLRSELEEIENRLRSGSLGGWMNNVEHLTDWQTRLAKAKERSEFAELLIELEKTVPEKYSSGIFIHPEKKSFQIWMNDCRSCSTYSRLYVLTMVFENAIRWNKSPVGMKCKVCRKKHKEESILVCDQCSHAYHPQCLKIHRQMTNDRWYCPACRPEIISTRRQRKLSSSSSSSEEEEEEESASPSSSSSSSSTASDDRSMSDEEHLCCVCESDQDIFPCHQCGQYYHCGCHQPPLRCPPRSNRWICNPCRIGLKSSKEKKTMTKKTKTKTMKRKTSEPVSDGRRRSKRLRLIRTNSDEGQSMEESDH